MTIRVIAVDDHHLILKALSDLLNEQADIELVATSTLGSQLINLVRDHNPDVAIVDIGMRADAFDPITSVRTLHKQYPDLKILILTGYDDGLWVRELVKAGASGYMLKSDDFSLNIPQAIRALDQGNNFYSPAVAGKLIKKNSDMLTARELSLLNLLSQGFATDAIAEKLNITDKRVRNSLVVICDKLEVDRGEGLSPRVSAINKARELGLIP